MTAALQAAIDSNIEVYAPEEYGPYAITSVDVDSETVLYGRAEFVRNVQASNGALVVSANGVRIHDIKLTGPGAGAQIATTDVPECGIQVNGVSSAAPVTDLYIERCTIDGWAGCGIRADYVRDAWISENNIQYCGYAGLLGVSLVDAEIRANRIDEIDSVTNGTSNWYGIAVTRDATRTLALSARSTNVVIESNTVSNVPQWTGIDSHALYKSQIVNNKVYFCANGIYTQYDSSSETNRQPSEHVLIANNMVEGPATTSEAALGIASLGLAGMPNRHITIKNNHMVNCGSYNNAYGAIYVNETQGLAVVGNEAESSVRVGLGIDGTTTEGIIKDNRINGVVAGASSASFMFIDLTQLTAVRVEGNRFFNDTGNASADPARGIFYAGSNGGAVFAKNRIKDLTGSNFIEQSGGSANDYTELNWELESEQISFSFTATGGAPTETTGSQQSAFRRLPTTGGTPILNVAAEVSVSSAAERAHGVSPQNGNIYTALVYTRDGTNIAGSTVLNPIVLRIDGVYWDD